jgi:hypothetical protein
MLYNNAAFSNDLLALYADEGNHPVLYNCEDDICTVVIEDLVSEETYTAVSGDVLKRSLIRHDSDKLAHAVLKLF